MTAELNQDLTEELVSPTFNEEPQSAQAPIPEALSDGEGDDDIESIDHHVLNDDKVRPLLSSSSQESLAVPFMHEEINDNEIPVSIKPIV